VSVRDDVEAVRQGLMLLELAPVTSRVINGLIKIVEAKKQELDHQVALNTELQKAIGKERDYRADLEKALNAALAEWQNYFSAEGEFTGDTEPALNFYLEIEKIAGKHL
jgi:hypothetical protein